VNIIFKKDTWQEIYYSLRNNKLRTFLTMIGVGWGMFLYVSLLGAAKGMENGFDKLFSGLQPILFSYGRKKHPFLTRDFLKEEMFI
jgi:ABC-type antimicrobial peptide transport system permease subunit